MELKVTKRWDELRRAAEGLLLPARDRLWSRHAALGVGLVCTLFFLVAGGLSVRAGLVGLVAAVAWAAFWPLEEDDAARHGPRAASARGDPSWRTLVNAMPQPAFALNNVGEVLHANRMAQEVFGVRRRSGHIASMTRAPELLSAVDQALESREAQVVELHERVPVERRLLATVTPLEAIETIPEGPALLISFRDLTEQDRLARMRADFVANASHELRTPLASLRGYVETLQGSARNDPEASARFLKTMGEQAERMSRLVDDLLSLSRVEMREYLPPAGEVELGAILAEVVQLLDPIARSAGITLQLQPYEAPAIVRGEPDELLQVFQNLVQNAIKYGRPNGRVEMRLLRELGTTQRAVRYRIDVVDDGPGIAPHHLPRLTERFYRVNVAASREKGGTGLGLAIVKHILNRHRGELFITSKLGQGSTFSVMLPALNDPKIN